MLPSTEIKIREIRLQNEINDIPEVRLADGGGNVDEYAEYQARWGAGNASLAAVRAELIAALEKEDQEAQAAMARNVDTSGWTAEMREFHQLGQRTSMAEYMSAGIALRHLAAGTPEHEYNSHVFGDTWNVGEYPLEMLLDRNEYFSLEASQAAQMFSNRTPNSGRKSLA